MCHTLCAGDIFALSVSLLFPFCVHGCKQEMMEPLFFLSSRTAEEVKNSGKLMVIFGGSWFWTG